MLVVVCSPVHEVAVTAKVHTTLDGKGPTMPTVVVVMPSSPFCKTQLAAGFEEVPVTENVKGCPHGSLKRLATGISKSFKIVLGVPEIKMQGLPAAEFVISGTVIEVVDVRKGYKVQHGSGLTSTTAVSFWPLAVIMAVKVAVAVSAGESAINIAPLVSTVKVGAVTDELSEIVYGGKNCAA